MPSTVAVFHVRRRRKAQGREKNPVKSLANELMAGRITLDEANASLEELRRKPQGRNDMATFSTTKQELWGAYREGAGGKNHDGTYALPENVDDLAPSARKGWARVAEFVDKRIEALYQKGYEEGSHFVENDQGETA